MNELKQSKDVITYNIPDDDSLLDDNIQEPHPLYNIQLSEAGLPFEKIKKIQDRLHFTNKEISGILHISETSYQRLHKKNATLDAESSEKTIELTELIKKGKDVFGSIDEFRSWLYEPNFSLGSKKPIELLSSSIGSRYVMTILHRIEWGIYS